jgi:hypothetical protein
MFNINYIFLLYIMNNKYILSVLLLLLLLLIVFPLKENFSYKAPYFRSQLYQNVCEPDYGGLLRVKRTLRDNCLRTLEDTCL